MQAFSDFAQRFRNARCAIQQIRAGEWTPRFNPLGGENYAALRGDMKLWIGNGAFFCEITTNEQGDPAVGRYFGLVWRHWVWWAAARKLRRLEVPILENSL